MEFGNLPAIRLQEVLPRAGQGVPEQALRAVKQGDEEVIRKASQDFEAVFLNLLLKEMRKAIPKGGVFERSTAREWFEGMMDEAVAREASRGRGIGLAQAVFEQMRQAAGAGRKQAAPGALPAPKPEEEDP